MKILAIESSCDETAAAVIEDGKKILSNVVASQIKLHAKYGGIVPEVAARSHIEAIIPVIDQSLHEASLNINSIDAIAVAKGPGLIGSLLIGVLSAKTIAKINNLPLIGVNHVFAHPFANFLQEEQPQFPMLALIVSGGHTQLMWFKKNLEYKLVGSTQDDAAGEAFDKVAKLIGLGYPGGPAISQTARRGNSKAFLFPKAKLTNPYDFSFSGLKTAVLNQVIKLAGKPNEKLKKSYQLDAKATADIAASFQRNVVEILCQKTLQASEELKPVSIVIGGGVAANLSLRKEILRVLPQAYFVKPKLCTDNAAMIGALAYQMMKLNMFIRPSKLKADSSLETL